jgi:hypothetical protein
MDQRNDHVLQRHGETLKQLALQASREGAVMKELSQKMQKDSQVMRVLTSVAFIYLPPSLVAVCRPSLFRPSPHPISPLEQPIAHAVFLIWVIDISSIYL